MDVVEEALQVPAGGAALEVRADGQWGRVGVVIVGSLEEGLQVESLVEVLVLKDRP